MNKKCPEVGKSNVQEVWVEIEDNPGVLQKLTANGYIVPRGNASMNQVPTLTDSEELSESLNVTAQFQNAVEPGEASIPMYMRLVNDGGKMQGHTLLLAAMGNYQEGGTAQTTLNAENGVDKDAEILPVNSIVNGIFPPRGIIQIDDEKIRYLGVERTGGVITALTQCKRGQQGTTAVDHADEAEILLLSPCYYQDTCRHTVSVWMKNDHLVTWGSGGVVTATEIALSNEGGQQIDFTVQFRREGWAGRSLIKAVVDKTITVQTKHGGNASWGYTEGSYILNTTKHDDNNGEGYRITAVDHESGTITLESIGTDWAEGDRLDAWTPKSEPIGEPVESRSSRVSVGGIVGAIREGSFSMGTPAEFLAEIGDEYPGESVDTKRDISITMNGYLRCTEAQALGRGYEGYDTSVALVFGRKDGQRLGVCLPRVKMNMPEIGVDGAIFTLDRTGRVLGINGEDAVFITRE